MKVDAIEKILSLLPDGHKKRALQEKIKQLKSRSKPNKGGLHDQFEFEPKGRIKIEEIDETGKVVNVLAEQSNLVVNGAEEILLRAFSGDPERLLFKNRIPKNKETKKFHVNIDQVSKVVNGVDQLAASPNTFWKAVDDNEFEVSYSYHPITVYLREEVSDRVGHKAFTVHSEQVSGSIPLPAEVYSAHTNMFIGIGDGKHYDVSLDDERLTYSGNWSDKNGHKVSNSVGDRLEFTQKISNFVLGYQKSNTGGQIEVYIDDSLVETIETYDSELTEPVVQEKVFDNLDHENEHHVLLHFSGADPSVESPEIEITSLKFDALDKSMNGLIHEFENYTNRFDTTTAYNTTTTPPYVIQLNHFPVKLDSIVVDYNGQIYTRVSSLDDVTEGTYYADEKYGRLYFSRAHTNVLVTYETTGEIYALVDAAKLPGVTVTRHEQEKDPDTGELLYWTDETMQEKTTGETDFPVFVDVQEQARELTLDFEVKDQDLRVINYDTQEELTFVTSRNDFKQGTFMINDRNKRRLTVHEKDLSGSTVLKLEVLYKSDEQPGVPTGYCRAIIEKPKSGINYPWYSLDKGEVEFVAEFPEGVPNHNVTIREMGLFDGPRPGDGIDGFNNYPVDAFSLVRVGETRKEASTGLRVTWVITLVNKDGEPYKGGY